MIIFSTFNLFSSTHFNIYLLHPKAHAHSGIRNEIKLVDLEVVWYELLHVESLEVGRQCTRDYWLDMLGLDLGLGDEFETFVDLLICGLTLEPQRLVRLELYHRRAAPASVLSDLTKHAVVLPQLPLLFLSIALLVVGLALEG